MLVKSTDFISTLAERVNESLAKVGIKNLLAFVMHALAMMLTNSNY